jgi:hypothetical protein
MGLKIKSGYALYTRTDVYRNMDENMTRNYTRTDMFIGIWMKT